MQQYNNIKFKYPDAMLLFRVGDFYETFGDDAIKAAKILGIVLTKRGAGSETETALAGFPYHSLNTYLPKLVKAGLRVAICDQLEDPKMTKTIVKRGVTELVTPGVALNDEVLQAKKNNFLSAIHFGKKNIGISFLDVSTGEFLTAQGNVEYIDKLLQNFSPSEVLIQKQNKQNFKTHFGEQFYTFYLEDWIFQNDFSYESLTNHFEIKAKINSVKGTFILDTGASNSCVGFDEIEIFNLKSEDSEHKASGAGTTEIETQISKKNKLKIGKFQLKKTPLILINLSHINIALVKQNAKPVQGIIGADILHKGKAIIDYKKKKLYL